MSRLIFLFITLIIHNFASAKTENKTHDSLRPINISDSLWNSLETTILEEKLLPNPEGVGGEKSLFGKSVYIDGNRALIGAINALDHGVVYVLDYNGTSWEKSATLIPSLKLSGLKFGSTLSLSGNRAIIGHQHISSLGGGFLGRAFIYDLINGNWVETILTPSNPTPDTLFGFAVSISGNRAIVGAPSDTSIGNFIGAVYIFDLVNGNWIETKLHGSDVLQSSRYGNAVFVEGNKIVVGAYSAKINGASLQGAVYVYELNNGNWAETKLTASDGEMDDYFGISVGLDNNRIIVGAPGNFIPGAGKGAAYIFNLSNGQWTENKIYSYEDTEISQFGSQVSIDNDRVLIGAFSNTNTAYLYELINENWIETSITPTSNNTFNALGQSVSIFGNNMLIGASADADGLSSGIVFSFKKTGNFWIDTELTLGSGASLDRFGNSVSLYKNRALIGSPNDNVNGLNSGSAYVFDLIGNNWTSTILTPSDAMPSDEFGYAVSLWNNRAVISTNKHSGSKVVYLFEFIEGNWIETKQFISNDVFSRYGSSVSIYNNYILIGSPKTMNNGVKTGAVFLQEQIGNNWIETIITPSNGNESDNFGQSISINNNTLLVGAPNHNPKTAYLYKYEQSVWQETKIIPTNPLTTSNFGYSVSISENQNRVLIGGLNFAFIYDFIDAQWVETELTPSDINTWDQFGSSVSLSGDHALIGAYFRENSFNSQTGVSYIFDLINGTWESSILAADDSSELDLFGYSVSLSGRRGLISAIGNNENGLDSGSAYIIHTAPFIYADGFE